MHLFIFFFFFRNLGHHVFREGLVKLLSLLESSEKNVQNFVMSDGLPALSQVLNQLKNIMDSGAKTNEVGDCCEETENDVYKCLSINGEMVEVLVCVDKCDYVLC
jgi:hypothetical protein